MKIDLALNPSLLKGVVNTEMTDAGLRLYRHPDHIRFMPTCTAGCRIAFRTNAAKLRLELLVPAPIHQSYHLSVSILVDGQEHGFFSLPDCNPDTPPRQLVCETELPGHEAGVEIFLPNYHCGIIRSFELSDGAYLTPLCYPGPPLLFLGDSITQGFYADNARSWSSLIARAWHSDFFNLGVGGAKMAEAPSDAAMKLPWKRAFVAYGVNDSGPNGLTAEQFYNQTLHLLSQLVTRKNAIIYLLTPIPLLTAGEVQKKRLELFREKLKCAGSQFPQVQLIDGHTLVEENPALFFDGCHPNEKGMEMYAKNLLKQISEA